MFNRVYDANEAHLRTEGGWYGEVDMRAPSSSFRRAGDALGAFYPGMQVGIGDIDKAARSHANFVALLEVGGSGLSLPEQFVLPPAGRERLASRDQVTLAHAVSSCRSFVPVVFSASSGSIVVPLIPTCRLAHAALARTAASPGAH